MKALQLVLAGVLFSACAFAGVVDEPALAEGVAVTHVSGSSVLKVYYSSGQTEDVKIAILNKKNKVIFSETIKKASGFLRPYNLSGLDAGTYTVVVEHGNSFQKEQFTYSAGRIEKLINIMRLPEEGKYLLSVKSKASDVVNVNVYDRDNKLIHSQSHDVKDDFAEVLNLKAINQFTIEISDSQGVLKTLRN
ncbi:MAG TPA: hypothetical protein PKK67_12365 [Cyclobacteriaceae bacterium]|nr:MAG: hypothetical protein UZ12_BCD005001491 [Bacteroidetes bacterium OLB12]HNT51377.1 hypothetical protein [Cyclobacteriaceae bacterium]